jgi:type II secretory pathway pseudopilin PulG
MSTADWVEYLKISTMIFFHVFLLISLIGAIFLTVAVAKIQRKINETLEKANQAIENIQEAAFSVGDAGSSLVDFLTPLVFRRKNKGNGFWSIIKGFLSK